MKVTMFATLTEQEDGYDGTIEITREDVPDLQTLAHAVTDFTVAVGFCYVKAVGYECKNGEMIWGDL
jgi:hypothetical protein|tara:strand:+ start:5636 stop:5836 length:201 start_codon:yes stop_codon:yes gene_type:complete